MNSKTSIYGFILSVLLTGCIGSIKDKSNKDTSKAVYTGPFLKEHNNSVEFLEILDKFTSGNNDWAIEENNMHYKWVTGGEIGNDKMPEYVPSNFTKQGSLYLLMDNSFSGFYHEKRDQPVPWTLNMYGGRTLWLQGMLKTEITGGNNSIPIIDYLKKKKVLMKADCYELKEDAMSYGIETYSKLKIKLDSGREIYILLEELWMNNVCDEAIYFNYDGSEDITLPPDFDSFHTKKTKPCIE